MNCACSVALHWRINNRVTYAALSEGGGRVTRNYYSYWSSLTCIHASAVWVVLYELWALRAMSLRVRNYSHQWSWLWTTTESILFPFLNVNICMGALRGQVIFNCYTKPCKPVSSENNLISVALHSDQRTHVVPCSLAHINGIRSEANYGRPRYTVSILMGVSGVQILLI